MCEARQRDAWARMSALLALTANCHRDPKKSRALKPGDFDPFARPAEPVVTDMATLKAMFTRGKPPPEGPAG